MFYCWYVIIQTNENKLYIKCLILDNYEYSELLKLLNKKLSNIEDILNPTNLDIRLDEIKKLEEDQEFWINIQKAKQIGIEKNILLSKRAKFQKASSSLKDSNEIYKIAIEEDDEETMQLLYDESSQLEELIKSTEIEMF